MESSCLSAVQQRRVYAPCQAKQSPVADHSQRERFTPTAPPTALPSRFDHAPGEAIDPGVERRQTVVTGTHHLEIDAPTQAVIESLDGAQRERLHSLIVQADRIQREQLEHAVENAVSVVPAPFRKRFLKLLFG
jgi:hypothetical protein